MWKRKQAWFSQIRGLYKLRFALIHPFEFYSNSTLVGYWKLFYSQICRTTKKPSPYSCLLLNPLARFLIVKPYWKGLSKTFLMRSGNQKSSHERGHNIDFRRRCSIFTEIDILTLSVAPLLIVGPQWKALKKIFPMRSNNLKSSHGQDQDINFCVSHSFREKSTPWPCLWLDFFINKPHLKGLYRTFLMRSGNQKSSRGQGQDIDFWRRRSIFAEIDILTLSVTRFLIVGPQWKALEKIFPMRSNKINRAMDKIRTSIFV